MMFYGENPKCAPCILPEWKLKTRQQKDKRKRKAIGKTKIDRSELCF